MDRLVGWSDWYRSSCVSVLHTAAALAQQEGVRMAPQREEGTKDLQRELYAQLRTPQIHAAENRIRNKLQRWQRKLGTPIGTLTRRLQPRMLKLSGKVPPRVMAAVFRTIWNGWCTAARSTQTQAPCVLQCSDTATDRIEHYACCPHTRWLARRAFAIEERHVHLGTFLLLDAGMSDQDINNMALVVYAVYTVVNRIRHDASRTARTGTDVRDALENAIKLVTHSSRVSGGHRR